jgi:transposase
LGDRLFVEAVLFRAKTGLPWRDLPERFGPWKSVYNRFSNWARKGHWLTIFKVSPRRMASMRGARG